MKYNLVFSRQNHSHSPFESKDSWRKRLKLNLHVYVT